MHLGTAATYLQEMCNRCSDSRLRSATYGDIRVLRSHVPLTDRSFAVSGREAWNTLPSNNRGIANKETLCRHLKAYFYQVIYSCKL